MEYKSICDEVIFFEGTYPGCKIICGVNVKLLLDESEDVVNIKKIKKMLAKKVKELGGNCIIEFNYGGRVEENSLSVKAFYGDGIAAILSKDEYRAIIEEKIIVH